jgi:uncharacterized membrane protein YdjX (TVP38/TMEM64 family)
MLWAGIITATGIVAAAVACFFVVRATVSAVTDIAKGNDTLG